jgi:hypothetical protein
MDRIASPNPNNGLGSGPARGLVREHAYLGTPVASDPSLRLGPKARGRGEQTLSKTGQTVKNPRPSGYGAFALQRDQGLFTRTPNLVALASGQIGLRHPTLAMARSWTSFGKAVMNI